MDEFIKLLDQDYELVRYRIKDKEVIFHIKSSKRELSYPFCGSKSKEGRPGGQKYPLLFDAVKFIECLETFEKRKYHCVQEQHL